MSAFVWTETTADWGRPNPYRRHSGWCEATQTEIALERDTHVDPTDYRWLVGIRHQTGSFVLPGGDLPDDEAKRLAPAHLASVLRRLLEALS